MRNSSALCRTLEKFTHSDFDLPILLSLEHRAPPAPPRAVSPPLPGAGRADTGPSQGGTYPDACICRRTTKPAGSDLSFKNPSRRSCLRCSSYTHLVKNASFFSFSFPCFDVFSYISEGVASAGLTAPLRIFTPHLLSLCGSTDTKAAGGARTKVHAPPEQVVPPRRLSSSRCCSRSRRSCCRSRSRPSCRRSSSRG